MGTKNKYSDLHRQYFEARDLAADAAKAIADNRSINDCPRIMRFLRRNEFSEETISRLSSAEYNRHAYDTIERYDRQKELDRFLNRLDEVKRKAERRKRKRLRIRLVSMAGGAAAAVIAMFIYFSGGVTDKCQSERQISLILSDGRSIPLDDRQHSLDLVEETGSNIRNEDGTLIIEKNGEEAGQVPSHYTLDVSQGYQYDVILEDKTHVWLNSGSYLRFPAAFEKGERRVFVEGEAYFEVAEDAGRPFIVETAGQTLTVLGTTFNLYAYRDEPVIYTTLVSGRVLVKSAAGELTLTPDQSCELDRNSNEFSVRKVRAETVAEWRKGDIFIFDDNTLEQVLMKISRWYEIDIAFDEQYARAFVYKGNLPKYENVEDLLESLEMTGPMKFAKEKNGYVMTR